MAVSAEASPGVAASSADDARLIADIDFSRLDGSQVFTPPITSFEMRNLPKPPGTEYPVPAALRAAGIIGSWIPPQGKPESLDEARDIVVARAAHTVAVGMIGQIGYLLGDDRRTETVLGVVDLDLAKQPVFRKAIGEMLKFAGVDPEAAMLRDDCRWTDPTMPCELTEIGRMVCDAQIRDEIFMIVSDVMPDKRDDGRLRQVFTAVFPPDFRNYSERQNRAAWAQMREEAADALSGRQRAAAAKWLTDKYKATPAEVEAVLGQPYASGNGHIEGRRLMPYNACPHCGNHTPRSRRATRLAPADLNSVQKPEDLERLLMLHRGQISRFENSKLGKALKSVGRLATNAWGHIRRHRSAGTSADTTTSVETTFTDMLRQMRDEEGDVPLTGVETAAVSSQEGPAKEAVATSAASN